MPHPLEWFLFAMLVDPDRRRSRIRIAAIEASISVADTFFICSALLFGPGRRRVALAADSLLLSWRKGHDWSRVAFNTVAPALSLWVAGQAFFLIDRRARRSPSRATSPIGPLHAARCSA